MKTIIGVVLLLVVIVTAGMALGATWQRYETNKGSHSATAPIPRCVHDDYNDGSQVVCYTVNTETWEVIVLTADDVVVSGTNGE